MNIVQLIEKKANKGELSIEELQFIFKKYTQGEMKDYQMSSLLMAILINGMSDKELFEYTKILIESGHQIEFNDLEHRVDKHSTGGIGDKISIILSPILAANGVNIGKISGRGLGFTGGTIDKLESIPGFNLNLDLKTFIANSERDGISIINTSDEFAPLDKKIYALRDVTGTVESEYLIAASIMSKKLLVNSKYIFIDLKCGDGAFFKTIEEANKMAKIFKKIAQKFNREIFILITSMDQPLGNYIGNSLEIWETIDILSNVLKNDASELAIYIASRILSKINNVSIEKAQEQITNSIENGLALESFKKWMKNQSADLEKFIQEGRIKTKFNYSIKAPKSGYISFNNTIEFGYGLIELGGGRKLKEDLIDYNVGFNVHYKNDEHIEKFSEIISIYSNKELSEEFINKISSLISIKEKKGNFKTVLKEISW